jgi:RNA polymerase sigma factor (sigma-70 family)
MNIQERNVLVEKNLPLVPIALREIIPDSGPGKRYAGLGDWDDAMQVGTLGLIRATEKFEPERGHRFGHFAIKRIKWRVQRALCEESLIHVPHTALWGQDEEKKEYARRALGIINDNDCNRTKEYRCGYIRKRHIRYCEEWEDRESLSSMLRRLEPLDRELFHLVYWEDLSLREAGKRCNLSHERVRQRLDVAKKRLKKWLS